MMLQSVMGTPLLCWLVRALIECGVGRFFLVCHEKMRESALACFPQDVYVCCAEGEDTSDQLHVFLSTADQDDADVLVVTGPCVILPFSPEELDFSAPPAPSGMTSVRCRTLMDALDESFIFTDFLKAHGVAYTDRDGVFAVSSLEELAEWQPILRRGVLYRHAAQGVEIWDYDNAYLEPDVRVGRGTAILPGTILRGRTVIGEDCVIGPNAYLENTCVGDRTTVNSSQLYDASVGSDTHVGPFAYVRPGSRIGDHVRAGDFVEIKNSTIGDGTKISHLTYVGDSDVGKNINFGCGTVTVNYDRAKKFRTTIEDNAFIGCNTNLVAPVRVGQGAYIAAGSTITEDVPPAALAIARARQANKRDWSLKHKLKEKK